MRTTCRSISVGKITPVRWWRSEEDRYKDRPSYPPVSSPIPDSLRWQIELLPPMSPELMETFAVIERMRIASMVSLCDAPAMLDITRKILGLP